MHQSKSIASGARHIAAICLAALVFAIGPLSCGFAAQPAKSTVSSEAETTPAKVHELLTLLADPKVQQWLEKEAKSKAASQSAPENVEESISHYFDAQLGAVRTHILALAAALPDVPNQFRRGAALLTAELGEGGRTEALTLLVVLSLCLGVEWLFRWATQGSRAARQPP
jgi:hypothetical protein